MVGQREIASVAVVGTGLVGFGWAHVFARGGLHTRVFDADDRALRVGVEKISRSLELLCEEGLLDEDAVQQALNKVTTCRSLGEAVEDADYVQESVPERLELKQRVFCELDELTRDDCILASSVAGLLMTDIAAPVRHPERCVVAHPTNPPHLIPLVEIAAGEKTSPEVVETTTRFMERIGQAPVVVRQEIFAYVLNRLQYALFQEAYWLAIHGIASVSDIDKVVTHGLGLRWAFTGPFLTEELNSESIERSLREYKDDNKTLWRQLGRIEDYSDDDVDVASAGLRPVLDHVSREDLLEWRDRMVLRARALKKRNSVCEMLDDDLEVQG